ncbi:hypothetical protein Nepgr_002634 [Nepenthes gracilis]|uniref:Uncharacterized protein n=1 Tax=Nepenthes gracilis TaxID=150966 RepID=A0AAD3P434_NEPGR|nr:hypothetical protein Nepgr_002634 [Nepenthes gracilis]
MLGEFALLDSVDPLDFASGCWCCYLVRMLLWAVNYNEFHGLFVALHASDLAVSWKLLCRCWSKGADLNCFLFSSPIPFSLMDGAPGSLGFGSSNAAGLAYDGLELHGVDAKNMRNVVVVLMPRSDRCWGLAAGFTVAVGILHLVWVNWVWTDSTVAACAVPHLKLC